MKAVAQSRATQTTCPYCGVGCGVLARVKDDGSAVITGDPEHPANFGKLCSKGFALDETLNSPNRLLHPMMRGTQGKLAPVTWDGALEAVASGFQRIAEQHGPDAVAFYLSGQLLTEDYYVANKLMKGFIGSANVDTNSRLCMASSVAGHRRAFGADVVPGTYEDLDQADLIVLVGSNAAWCHPVLFQRMLRAREERGAKLVVIDPRRTYTAQDADLFLSVAPGMDTVLFAGLLAHLADSGALDASYVEGHTANFADALRRAREIAPDIATAAAKTRISADRLALFYSWFATTERVVTCYSQGVNQSAQGTDKVGAIINCHLATARIGKPGMGPFSLTGQPNAMGGREVGGLANQLAAHMTFAPDDVDRVRRFWNAPRMATREGRKAVDMFAAAARGEIKAIWVMGTNPAASLPNASEAREALARLELLVVSDCVQSNDTINAGAHILLPAAPWGERDGTVTNSERCITRQRPFLSVRGDAKPDWQIVCEVARRMGYGEAFAFKSPADVFREHAALSCFENADSRAFDIGGVASLSDLEYDCMPPTLWPIRADGSQPKRLFAAGGYFTLDRKARFVAPEHPGLRDSTSSEFPLVLNTGRIRDQWHTMTRTGDSVRLAAHRLEPFVEVHPLDAARYRLSQSGYARVTSAFGACVLKVVVTATQQPGSLFVPIHWTDETSSSAAVSLLVTPATDPFSGQPEAKATPVSVAPVSFAVQGFAIAKGGFPFPADTWWSRVPLASGFGYLIASSLTAAQWRAEGAKLFSPSAILTEYFDPQLDLYRVAAFVEGEMAGALFVSRSGGATHASAFFGLGTLAKAGICACFDVSLSAVRDAVAGVSNPDVASIGRALRAGTKCGTCLPELRSIVARSECKDALGSKRDRVAESV